MRIYTCVCKYEFTCVCVCDYVIYFIYFLIISMCVLDRVFECNASNAFKFFSIKEN